MNSRDVSIPSVVSHDVFFVADAAGQAKGQLDRTVLPIPEPKYTPITELDARNAKAPPRFEVKAPQGAPNVVIVLIDDIGFGHSSAFGGPIHMPTLEKLAASGLKYNRFHTTALCSPTRMALLTGRNHHVEQRRRDHGTGHGLPRQHRRAPRERHAAGRDPAPERLQHRGLRQVPRDRRRGKSRSPARSIAGPRAPGFDKFYGFIGGETNQWAPAIYDGVDARRAQADARLPLHRRT